jgi:glycine/D-amino acid oxidase-like deaminating enzyme
VTELQATPDLGRSWWLREALSKEEFADPPAPPLRSDIRADVVILGGGYTGMWTAWFLKEREPGIDVVLLEADICGGGPSGRNGGFCDGWLGNVADLLSTFGKADATELVMASSRSPGQIERWCRENSVDAWFTAGGDLAISTSRHQDGRWRATIDAGRELGLEDEFQVLSEDEVGKRARSPLFRGGMFIADSANLQPARLARGLRRALLGRGVRVYEATPVTRFGSGKPATCETPDGTVRADRAVIALGAWATPWRRFRPYLTVRGSYMVITEPAPEKLEEIGWTGGEAIRDLRSSIHYLRTTPDGRIAFGMGGLQPTFARGIDRRYAHDERMIRRVADDLLWMFPTLADVPIEAGWGGPINVSALNLPFFGTLQPGNVHFGLGYTGNGVAPSHLGGQILAALATDADDGFTRLAVVTRDPMRFPPEPVRTMGMAMANRAIVRKDDREVSGRRAGPVTRTIARVPRRLGFNLGPR